MLATILPAMMIGQTLNIILEENDPTLNEIVVM